MSPPRLILDTNILLDLFFFQDPTTEPLRVQLSGQQVQLLASAALVREFSGVLKKEAFCLNDEKQQEILHAWLGNALLIQDQAIEAAPWTCRDSTDQMFLDLAYSCRPITLISKDKQVLKLGKRAARDGVRITKDLTTSCD